MKRYNSKSTVTRVHGTHNTGKSVLHGFTVQYKTWLAKKANGAKHNKCLVTRTIWCEGGDYSNIRVGSVL